MLHRLTALLTSARELDGDGRPRAATAVWENDVLAELRKDRGGPAAVTAFLRVRRHRSHAGEGREEAALTAAVVDESIAFLRAFLERREK